MIKYKIKLFLGIMVFFVLILCPKGVFAKTPKLSDYSFEMKLNSDSSISVIEIWNVELKNTNTLYKNFDISEQNFSNVKVVEIDSDKEKEYEQIESLEYHVTNGCFYAMTNKDGRFEIAWNCDSEKEKSNKTFKVCYDIKNYINVYKDCAIFNWKFIENNFDIPIKRMSVKMNFNTSIGNEMKLGYNGIDNLNIEYLEDDSAYFEIEDCKKVNYLEILSILPVNAFFDSDNYIDGYALDSAQQIIRKLE